MCIHKKCKDLGIEGRTNSYFQPLSVCTKRVHMRRGDHFQCFLVALDFVSIVNIRKNIDVVCLQDSAHGKTFVL